MKIQPKTYQRMYNDIMIVFKALPDSGKNAVLNAKGNSIKTYANQLWHIVWQDHKYSDTHPKFEMAARIFAFDPDFEIYPDNTNDDTLTTALVKIVKQIQAVHAQKGA